MIVLKQGAGRSRERHLMYALSDALGIPHHDCSAGGTVERAFLVDMAKALGVDNAEQLGKYPLLHACHALLYDRSMPADCLSEGKTVTNAALGRILQGYINRTGFVVPRGVLSRALSEAKARRASVFEPHNQPLLLSEERQKVLSWQTRRPAQSKFRDRLLAAYGSTCAVSGTNEPLTLDAAHITPFASGGSNRVSNGLLLRTDLHRLWDSGKIAIHETSYTVLLNASLLIGPYAFLAGAKANIPLKLRDAEQQKTLASQRNWARL